MAPTLCLVDDCYLPMHARGYCLNHYNKARRDGTLDMPDRPIRPVPELAKRYTDLRLTIEAAAARIRQAVIVMEYPHVAAVKGVEARTLLDEALDLLEVGQPLMEEAS